MSHLCYFLVRHLEGIHREEVARLQFQFTTHHFFIYSGVTVNLYLVDGSLNTFCDTYLKVDTVAIYIYFDRVDLIEHITFIIIEVGNCIVVFVQTFLDVLLVIHITTFHLEYSVQLSGVIH